MKQSSNKYFHWGLTAFLVILASIVAYVVLTNLPGFFKMISDLLQVLSPILLGVLFAYLLNPLVKMFEQVVVWDMVEKSKKPERMKKIGRVLAILFALVIAGIILYGLFYMVIPHLYDTVASLVASLPFYFDKARTWILELLKNNEALQVSAQRLLDNLYNDVQRLLGDDLVANLQTLMAGMTTFGVAIVTSVFNLLIGLVASVYMLLAKENFQAHAKRLVVATFRPRNADRILYLGREANRIFSGFVIGKILDSIIIGILCYIGMLILRLPFAVLISVVIGVTNVIPMFGPIIGAVPCTLLILIVNPLQALYFVIFVIVLQQLDGNVIGPKILGDSIGLSGFWVLFSITVFGNLFGMIGMLLGVPVFALVYIIVRDLVNASLRKKAKPLNTDLYYDLEEVAELPLVAETAAEPQEDAAEEPASEPAPEENENSEQEK
ncbi:MAG: AI-2E family transporter [Oscillospiraceae bacterium]|nr:AI-2E family transporter [Oscillospiraceae bacterium]